MTRGTLTRAQRVALEHHCRLAGETVNVRFRTQLDARQTSNQPVARRGTAAPSGCDQYGIPADIVIGESGCNPDAFNATGCGGRGCIGATQLDLGHFAEVSPWNGNVSGGCFGLDPYSYADQQECTSRLLGTGGLAHWGR